MTNTWILDVLADLKNFAQLNGMVALAEQLDDTKLLAAAEIAQGPDKIAETGEHYDQKNGELCRELRAGSDA